MPKKVDLCRLHREEYVAPRNPRVITVGKAQYLAICGRGAPRDAAFRSQMNALFGMAYAVKMAKKKLGKDFRRYAILGACNPPLAHRALETDPSVGLLLPCNVIVYEDGDGSVVAAVDPLGLLGVLDNPALQDIAQEAEGRLWELV